MYYSEQTCTFDLCAFFRAFMLFSAFLHDCTVFSLYIYIPFLKRKNIKKNIVIGHESSLFI